MNRIFRGLFLKLLPVFLLAAALVPFCHAAPVLMISIDGLKPEYITQADAHGMKLPYLRTLVRDGAYADGVVGIWPTVTYPSHTTLITGVWPVEHGIYNNLEFDPQQHYSGAWNWYAPLIRVPTLWKAAHQAGLRTASVGWPVSVGATDVDYLIPEYWRSADPSGGSGTLNPADRLLIAGLSRPAALIEQLQPTAGEYMMGNDTSINGDEVKTRYTIEILRKMKPAFMTLHLSSLDETQHAHGPFSAEADADLEALDGMMARLTKAAVAADPSAVVVLVSDHGFMNITHLVNLYIPFLQAGLIDATITPATKAPVIGSWKAEPWLAGGMAAVVLHDPNDRATEQQVKAMLDKLAADPANGIAQILDRDAIKQRGAFPDAAFLVVLKPGYYTGQGTSGDLVTVIPTTRGSHGFSPEYPEMHSSFFAVGAGIAQNRNLGVVDMRQIAPTVAQILKVQMPTAKATPLHVEK
ncbi:MAG TPA: ectonucleotide pyrophosphatase/phosphodiesterase [Terracidiphilus sp.]|jgi:predicted AlkP superfamily pyrophosphatase or phosphodiesterase|nr:ectonucleotide pyrophosphatase/phosphodiesterase [Terracidiphilus sp.]